MKNVTHHFQKTAQWTWDINTYECIKTLNGHADTVRSVVAINNHIISGSWDQTIKIWDINTYELIDTLYGHTSTIQSVFAINNIIISGSHDNSIKIWDIDTYA
jgi:WD40 repeat protein